MKRPVCLILLVFSIPPLFPQTKGAYRVETAGVVATGEHTPFWQINRQWGGVPVDANNLYVKGGVFHAQSLPCGWSAEAGADIVVANASASGNIWIQQLYARLNLTIWRLDVGMREDYASSLNARLSSGDFVKSNNARPIPEIKISLPEYLPVPYTKGNMYFKGDFSVGYYLDSRWKENTARPRNRDYTTDILSHRKSVYFRFGNIADRNRLQFTVEMDHAAQWGGKLYQFRDRQYVVIRQPQGIDDFIRMVVAKEGSAGASAADNAYVAGSQWGGYLFRFDYKLAAQRRLSIYTNHFFDDGSGMVFENYRDGLFGAEYKTGDRSPLSGVVFEYIYTKQQTGPIHHNIGMDDEHRDRLIKKGNGNDNYYNNTDYVQGPSHFGQSLGSPLLLAPIYNTDGRINFKSSRIIAFHLGVEGYLHPSLQYRLLLTGGQSWGSYYVPFLSVKKGVASLLELIYTPARANGFDIRLSAGCDNGEFFGGGTFGGSLTLRKQGIIYEN